MSLQGMSWLGYDTFPDRKGRAMSKPPLGSGERFRELSAKLAKRGAKNPDALAAYIGRKKYGAKKFALLSQKGK